MSKLEELKASTWTALKSMQIVASDSKSVIRWHKLVSLYMQLEKQTTEKLIQEKYAEVEIDV